MSAESDYRDFTTSQNCRVHYSPSRKTGYVLIPCVSGAVRFTVADRRVTSDEVALSPRIRRDIQDWIATLR